MLIVWPQPDLYQRGVRGGLVFKAHRLLYHSTLGWRVIKKKQKKPDVYQRGIRAVRLPGGVPVCGTIWAQGLGVEFGVCCSGA